MYYKKSGASTTTEQLFPFYTPVYLTDDKKSKNLHTLLDKLTLVVAPHRVPLSTWT